MLFCNTMVIYICGFQYILTVCTADISSIITSKPTIAKQLRKKQNITTLQKGPISCTLYLHVAWSNYSKEKLEFAVWGCCT